MSRHLHKDFRKIPFRWRLRYGFYQYFDHFLSRKFFFKLTHKSRRRFYKRLLSWLKEGGEARIVEVERLDDISQEDFFKNYVKKQKPVIITGKAKEWACCKTWSLDYFKELHGGDKILYVDQENVDDSPAVETTLGEVIDQIKRGESSYYRFYPILKIHPEHLLDFDYKWLRKGRLKGGLGEGFQVFISGKGGFTPIHNASANNIFTQAYGEKEWYLYPVDYTAILDPNPVRNLSRSAPIRNGVVFDPFEGNYDQHELYKYMDGYKVHLKQGDIFFNPGYMWHTVKNPTESIGVGYRYLTPVQSFFQAPLYNFLELFTINPPIWRSWRNYDDINMIHLAETGKLKEIAKQRGVKRVTTTVEAE